MKIYDVITLFNELDLLEMRFEILNEYVDYFVVNEATTTFTGKPKPLYYAENKDRFKRFNHKIIHTVFKENEKSWTQWDRDKIHKNASMVPLFEHCKNDDIVFYSDADEIPNFENINLVEFESDRLYMCHQDNYYYYLNALWEDKTQAPNFWRGSKYSSWGLLKYNSIDDFRNFGSYFHSHSLDKVTHVPNAGWHFSFLGGAENIKYKLNSYGHQELNVPYVVDNIQKNIDELRDPFFRPNFSIKIVPMSEETHPKYVMNNLDKYERYIYKK